MSAAKRESFSQTAVGAECIDACDHFPRVCWMTLTIDERNVDISSAVVWIIVACDLPECASGFAFCVLPKRVGKSAHRHSCRRAKPFQPNTLPGCGVSGRLEEVDIRSVFRR